MAALLKQYKCTIKSGTHGEIFQNDVALRLFLRMRECNSRFRLGYEVEEADKFDDVVLIDDGEKEIHFIQVKHADAKDDEVKNIDLDALFPTAGKGNNKGDFDLCKYFKSHQIVNQRFEEGASGEQFARKFYVLTNRDLPITEVPKFKELVEKVEVRKVIEILQLPKSQARHLKLTPTKKAIKELGDQINKDFIEVEKAVEELFNSRKVGSILKTYCTPLKDVLKMDKNKNCTFQESFSSESKQFSVASLFNTLKDKIDMTQQVTVDENFLLGKSRSNFQMLPPYVSEDEIKEFFCNSFTLSVGQPNDLRPVIDSEIRRWMKSCIRPDILGKLPKKELDLVFNDLKKAFYKLNEPNENKIKCALKKSDVEKCLEDIWVAYKNFESEDAKELQANYINRVILYKASANLRYTIDRAISDTDFVGELRGIFKDHQQIVLVAEPGMGKTSLLRFLAFEVQKQNDVVDVFLVYLSSLVKALDNVECISDLNDVLRVLSAVLSEESCEIIKNTSDERGIEGHSIVILFDGFDEIYSKYEDRVIEMFEQLTFKKSIQIVVSSRMHFKQLLESIFTLRSMFLQPFSEADQIRYLKKMWNVANEADPSFVNFTKQLLAKFHSSIPCNLRDIIGLPLMMRMLSEIYADRYEVAKTDNMQQLYFTKENFNIFQIYEQFVRKCFHMKFVEKYHFFADFLDRELDSVIEGNILEHQLLAMRLLDIDIFTHLTRNPHYKKKCDEFVRRCERESEKSILVKVVDNNVQFSHLSYGEYFVAKYMCDHIYTLGAEHAQEIWKEREVIRRLSMIKLEEDEHIYEIVNSLCKTHWDIALWVCESGSLGMVSYLVKHCESFIKEKISKMLQASAKIGHLEICELLLKSKSDPNGKYENGKTALHYAAENGHDAIVDLLLKNHANVGARSPFKSTALHLAAQKGHVKVVDMLLQRREKVHAQDKAKWTALHCAVQNGHATVVDFLLKNEAKVDAQAEDMWTALHLAALNGDFNIVELLLKNKADVNARTKEKWTALHYAAGCGHVNVVRLLLLSQAKVDAQLRDGWTALHLAAAYGHDKVVKLLIDRSANINIRTSNGETPCDTGIRRGHKHVTKLFSTECIDNKVKEEENIVQLSHPTENRSIRGFFLISGQVCVEGSQDLMKFYPQGEFMN